VINLIDAIIFSVTLSTVIILVVNNIRLAIKNVRLVDEIVQAAIDKMAMSDHMGKLFDENELLKMQGSDGFVKFLSESRDWAFSYIEEVQQAVKVLSAAMVSESEQEITSAYANLLKYLPEEEKNN
jgi:hypothetical protein